MQPNQLPIALMQKFDLQLKDRKEKHLLEEFKIESVVQTRFMSWLIQTAGRIKDYAEQVFLLQIIVQPWVGNVNPEQEVICDLLAIKRQRRPLCYRH